MLTFNATQPAGTMVHVETNDGTGILTFVPSKAYQSVVFSLPGLALGSEYIVYAGGSSTGISTDGLYEGGTYTAGTQVANFTISSTVTYAGSSSGMGPGGMPGNTTNITNGMPGNMTGGRPGNMTMPGNTAGGITNRMPVMRRVADLTV